MFIGSIEVGTDTTGINYRIPRDGFLPTRMAVRLVEYVLPEWLEQFMGKNRKYAGVDTDLGPAGIIPDINRKIGVLKDRIWFDGEVVGEPTIEVIDDLIGHLFLLRHAITEEDALDGTAPEHGPSTMRVIKG